MTGVSAPSGSCGALPASVTHKYLQLLCQLQPEQVASFISSQENYDYEDFLQVAG